jgi:hypothetical protein
MNAKPRQRQLIGHLEEYWTLDASGTSQYAGHRMVPESTQAIGSEHRLEFRLASDLVVNRSFSKVKTLKAGTLVLRMVSPLQGREMDSPQVQSQQFPAGEIPVGRIPKQKTTGENEAMKETKTKKPAAAKTGGKKFVQPSYAGRNKRIEALVAKGKKDAEILEQIKKEFPGSSPGRVLQVAASKRMAAKADAKPKAKKAASIPPRPAASVAV